MQEEDARLAHVRALENKVAEYSKLLELDTDQTADASMITNNTTFDLNTTQTTETAAVSALSEKADALENAYNVKRERALVLLRDIQAAWLALDMTPASDFDRRIINGIDNLVLSQNNLQKLQELANEVTNQALSV